MFFLFFVCTMLMCFQSGFADIKAVLFDCDGTLVESESVHYLAWKHTLSDLGRDFSLEIYMSEYTGVGGRENATRTAEKLGYDNPDALLKIKSGYFRELCKAGVPPIEPTVYFLKCLAAEKQRLGIKIGICSGASKDNLLTYIRQLGIEDLLDIILSGADDLKDYSDPEGVNKPKPYVYLDAMKKLGVLPAQCVVIEDSMTGVMAGASAGCFTIAVPNDYTRYHDLSRAHLRLESFEGMDIDDFFQMINESVGSIKSI